MVLRRGNLRIGFTLIELMISIALVLLLMIGVNFVFRTAATAVSAGQSINGFSRVSQAIQPALFSDFQNIDKNPPCFIIGSQIVTQFLNSDDAKTGANASIITIDNAGNTFNVIPALYNFRSHRTDIVRFFAHGFYPRRSGNGNNFTSPTTASDAFVTPGHAMLPSFSTGAFSGPVGDGSDPQTRVGGYASDWILERSVILLKADDSANGTITETYYPRQASPYAPSSGPLPLYAYSANMTPLGMDSPDSANAGEIQASRYDLAGVTPDQFRRAIADEIVQWNSAGNSGHLWWNPLIYNLPATQAATPTMTANTITSTSSISPVTYYTYSGSPTNLYSFKTGLDLARLECNPVISTPLTSAAIAQMAPYFAQHCSQFIVEYAGDYLTQDNTGTPTAFGPDGQIDYYIYKDANGNSYKRTRWYGMPRSNSGGTSIIAANGDVVPLRDYYAFLPPTGGSTVDATATPPWEVDVAFAALSPLVNAPTSDYAGSSTTLTQAAVSNGTARYACAWYNDMPAMIRITMKVDDPNNAIKDGPWYEFVFRLK